MPSLLRRRKLVAAVVLCLGLAGAGAFAYWTTSGSGTGTAPVGTSAAVTVKQTSTLTALYPGGAAQTLSGNFDNGNSGPVYVGTVTPAIASVTKAAGAPTGTCDATDFTLTGTATVNAQVPAGTAQGAWTGPTLQFNNKASNQDACKGATVNLSYTVS